MGQLKRFMGTAVGERITLRNGWTRFYDDWQGIQEKMAEIFSWDDDMVYEQCLKTLADSMKKLRRLEEMTKIRPKT